MEVANITVKMIMESKCVPVDLVSGVEFRRTAPQVYFSLVGDRIGAMFVCPYSGRNRCGDIKP
ncbi:hypothetical protein ACTXT7_008676 [Hymenolepis weldensis]